MKSLFALLTFLVPSYAFADHSLGDFLEKFPDAQKQITREVGRAFCDPINSEQLKPNDAPKTDTDLWKQVTLCYTSPKKMEQQREYGCSEAYPCGKELGVLSIEYNFKTGEILNLAFNRFKQ